MGKQHPAPRKQRTRQHVIADLSVHHVEGFILQEGHTAQRLTADYGYDMMVFTYDANGYAEPGAALVQLKASETLPKSGSDYFFDIDIRDYNLWTEERSPVILLLFDASRTRAYWLAVQVYFRANAARATKKGAKTVRLRGPAGQLLNRRGVAAIRELKRLAELPALFGGGA